MKKLRVIAITTAAAVLLGLMGGTASAKPNCIAWDIKTGERVCKDAPTITPPPIRR